MYELDQGWDAYFAEVDPAERRKLLNMLTDPQDEVWRICRDLYRQRYTDPKNPNRTVDTWLWKFVYLPGAYKRRRFLRKGLRSEMERTLNDLHLGNPDSLREVERSVLYWEYRNVARRYLSTCRGDRYGQRLFGLKKASEQEKRNKACEDIWIVSQGLAHATGAEKKLSLWCEALHDALLEFDPGIGVYYEQLERQIQK